MAHMGLRIITFFIGIIVLGVSASQVSGGSRDARVFVMLIGAILALLLQLSTLVHSFWQYATFSIIMIIDAVVTAVWLVVFVVNVVLFHALSIPTQAATVFAAIDMFLTFFIIVLDFFIGRRGVGSSSYV